MHGRQLLQRKGDLLIARCKHGNGLVVGLDRCRLQPRRHLGHVRVAHQGLADGQCHAVAHAARQQQTVGLGRCRCQRAFDGGIAAIDGKAQMSDPSSHQTPFGVDGLPGSLRAGQKIACHVLLGLRVVIQLRNDPFGSG